MKKSNKIIDALDVVTINGIEYVQTFCDDFDGDEIDTDKWVLRTGDRQQGGCDWNSDMVSLDGKGNLVLKADYIDGSSKLQCGAVATNGNFSQARGYFEIRCKMQDVDGFWSAFWIYPDKGCQTPDGSDDPYRQYGGTDGTEIDIFEQVNANSPADNGNSRIFQHALHWDGYSTAHRMLTKSSEVSNVSLYDGEYHVLALDWSEDEYVFYIDGYVSARIRPSELVSANDTCDSITSVVNSYLLVSLESSFWSGNPIKSKLPGSFSVDYVKAYQRVEYLSDEAKATVNAATTEPTQA